MCLVVEVVVVVVVVMVVVVGEDAGVPGGQDGEEELWLVMSNCN